MEVTEVVMVLVTGVSDSGLHSRTVARGFVNQLFLSWGLFRVLATFGFCAFTELCSSASCRFYERH